MKALATVTAIAAVVGVYSAPRMTRTRMESISGAEAPAVAQKSLRTTVVMLGTGTPIPDPDRNGPAVAIVVDSSVYLFDAGTGVVRRAMAAARAGTPQLTIRRLNRVFITHLHSDHVMGLNDVLFTPWIQGRTTPLEVYGPPGIQRLVNGILDGNDEDIHERLSASAGPAVNGYKANVHEVSEGLVYRDSLIRVTAFAVPHSGWKYAFGYRIDTPDRSIVVSGDARKNAAVVAACNGCDLLIHEVFSDSGFTTVPPLRKIYHANAHTSATELADIATASKTKHLVLYHQLFFGASDEQLLKEVRSGFKGTVSSAKDLDKY